MNTGRKTILLIVGILATLTVGCWLGKTHFSHSYIQEYMYYNSIGVRRSLENTQYLDLYIEPTYRVNFLSEGKDKAEFDNICKTNKDTGYDRDVNLPLDRPTISTEYPHFAQINVYSDKDFNAEHPAGTPLNDVMAVIYRSAQEYIESGYTADSTLYTQIVKPLNELSQDDLKLNLRNTFLTFTKDPDVISTHTLTFECINAIGERFTTTYNYDFSLKQGQVEPDTTIIWERY